MKAYVGDTVDDKPHKRNSVRLAIRKVGLCGYKTEGHSIKHNVHIPGYVRTQQARGPAQCRGFQRVHDVSQQTAFRWEWPSGELTYQCKKKLFRVFSRQRTVLPRGDNICQCSHSGEKTSKFYSFQQKSACVVKVRPRICQLHRNMLNALFKVNMFDSEWNSAWAILNLTRWDDKDEQVVDCLFIPLSLRFV